MRFHILIFGCQMNYSDSARIKAILTNTGMTYTDSVDDADIVIFDTCSVRQKSEDKVFWKLWEISPSKKIWLTGCMIQHNMRNAKIQNEVNDKKVPEQMKLGNFVWWIKTLEPEIIWFTNQEIEKVSNSKEQSGNIVYINHAFNPMFVKMQTEFPNVELFFRIDDTGFLPRILEKLGYQVNHDADITNEYSGIIPHGTNQLFKENTKTAYVPISTGCSQFCAYCIVPYARGLEKNRPVDEIIKEAEFHLSQGVEELVLLGQIVNKHPDFVTILKKILTLPGLKRLRYTSPYPTFYSPELLKLHETEEKLCPHIHMPLQSGSNSVLKKMFRGYTAEQFKWFVDNIRNLKRPISITTDIIIGFPDETEEDFQNSLEMIDYAKFDMIYMGIYSPRPGTLWARKYPDNISKAIKKERRNRMNDRLLATSLANNEKEINTQKEIIINKIDPDFVTGYTENMKTVIVKKTPKNEEKFNTLKLWHFYTVKIIHTESLKLFADLQP